MGFYDGGWWFEISQVVVFDLAADSVPSLCLESHVAPSFVRAQVLPTLI